MAFILPPSRSDVGDFLIDQGKEIHDALANVVEEDIAKMLMKYSIPDMIVYLNLIQQGTSHSRAWEVMVRTSRN